MIKKTCIWCSCVNARFFYHFIGNSSKYIYLRKCMHCLWYFFLFSSISRIQNLFHYLFLKHMQLIRQFNGKKSVFPFDWTKPMPSKLDHNIYIYVSMYVYIYILRTWYIYILRVQPGALYIYISVYIYTYVYILRTRLHPRGFFNFLPSE